MKDLAAMAAAGSVLIDGEWQEGQGPAFDVVDPATEQRLASVLSASEAQVDAAIVAAGRAHTNGPWSRFSSRERSRLLARASTAIAAHAEDLVYTVVREVGTPITLAHAIQVGGPIENFAWYSAAAERGPRGGYEEGMPLHRTPAASSSILSRGPVGVVVAMTAFNYPIQLLSWKLGGALASGCATIVLPSPSGVLSTIHCLRVLEEADLPPGAVNLVVGGADVGRHVTSAPGVDMVSFTGAAKTGARVMAQASATTKKVVLELGGKSPNILLPSADIGACVAPSILRFARNAGQGCGATTRILVPRDRFADFMAEATPFLESLAVGDPFDPETVVGPLINDRHRVWVEEMLESAVAGGAKIAAGGGRPAEPTGYYLNPALVVDAPNDAEICQEELFAPVASVLPYDTVDDAISMANASRYGLNASIYGDPEEAMDVASRLRSGTVQVNGGGGLRPDVPWGGSGDSGGGREMGEDGFAAFFAVKHVQWPLGGLAKPQGTG
jgi:aldehyde dehydrogenase (NAD+)